MEYVQCPKCGANRVPGGVLACSVCETVDRYEKRLAAAEHEIYDLRLKLTAAEHECRRLESERNTYRAARNAAREESNTLRAQLAAGGAEKIQMLQEAEKRLRMRADNHTLASLGDEALACADVVVDMIDAFKLGFDGGDRS